MARPEKLRRVGYRSRGRDFKPVGRPMSELDVEVLRSDELEALRLADLEGLYQETAAELMGVSRPTFSRILTRARTTVARAILNERALVLGEGPVTVEADTSLPCPIHGGERRRGRGCRCSHRNGRGRRRRAHR